MLPEWMPLPRNSRQSGASEPGIPVVCDVESDLAIAEAPILAEPLAYLFDVADASLLEKRTATIESVVAKRDNFAVDACEKRCFEMVDQCDQVRV
jgi:hypothetical protein